MATIPTSKQPTRYEVAVISTAAKPVGIIHRDIITATPDTAAAKARRWVAEDAGRRDSVNRLQMTISCHELRTRKPVDVPQHRVGR